MTGCATWILDLALLASLMLWVIREARKGTVPPAWAGSLLVLLVFFVAMARVLRMSFVGALFRVGWPLTALVIFAVWYGRQNPHSATSLFGSLLQLLIVLFGLYIMFRGLLGSLTPGKKN